MRPVVYPSDWMFREPQPPLSDFGRRFLAEGDSWFTIGTLNLFAAANLLFKLDFSHSTAIITCAYPGDTLQHMANGVNDPYFDRLLRKLPLASYFEAILVSAGGNDLIDAAQHHFLHADGSLAALDERILLTPQEAAVVNPHLTGPERHVSEAGWQKLAGYLVRNMSLLVQRRDQGPSHGRPLFLHTYAVPVVRPAGMAGRPQGWLYPAFEAYGISAQDRQGVAAELFGRLRQLLLKLDGSSGDATALPQVHVFDSATLAALVPADPDSAGNSGDWVNEIHPNPAGYDKIGRVFGAWIDQVLATYPG